MPVNRIAELMRIHAQSIWAIFNHWAGKALQADSLSGVAQLGIDEIPTRRGHSYVTFGVDMIEERAIHVSQGKGSGRLRQLVSIC